MKKTLPAPTPQQELEKLLDEQKQDALKHLGKLEYYRRHEPDKYRWLRNKGV